jgi:hypothetical protein
VKTGTPQGGPGDWSSTGLDNQVAKLLLALMAFGCVLVVLPAVGVLGGG